MNIQNSVTPANTTFTGYDARKLKGFIMNSNYAGIADDMKRIGEIENFKVYLFEKNPHGLTLKTDKFEPTNSNKGCWAQDTWGIIKNTILLQENSDKAELLKNIFKLKDNPIQKTIREITNYKKLENYVDILYNIPVTTKNGKPVIEVNTPDGIVDIDKSVYDAEFKYNLQKLIDLGNKTHIKGGNYFITKENEVLIGKNELKKFDIDTLKAIFQTDKIHIIPQADYHLDLFIRPLKDKKVLVADDETMLKTLCYGFEKIRQALIKSTPSERNKFQKAFVHIGAYMQQFREILKNNPYANMNKVEKALENAGYQPIKVPARLFEVYGDENYKDKCILKQLLNYTNAQVHINDNGETVYITNKSNLDEKLGLTKEIQKLTGFSLEKAFFDAVKPYVDKMYFVSGKNNALSEELLAKQYGGIHCMGAEIPLE